MLIGQGLDESDAKIRTMAAVDCASLMLNGERKLLGVDYSDVVELGQLGLSPGFDALIAGFETLREQMGVIAHAPAISAKDILTGDKTIPNGSLVFVGSADDVLRPNLDPWEGPAAIDWNASAPVMNTRIVSQLMLCDANRGI